MERSRIAYLIFLYCTRSLSSAEEKELKEWLDSDPHHKDLMQEMIDSQHIVDRRNVSAKFDEKRAWNQMKKKAFRSKYQRHFYIRIGVGIAASLLALFFITDFYLQKDTDTVLPVANTTPILPPQDGVILSYNDERKVLTDGMYTPADTLEMANDEIAEVDSFYIEVPRGNTFTMLLDDGTKIYLNSDSKIQAPRRFCGKLREVRLCYGEAFFDVAHDAARPFIVKGQQQAVRVLGTSFGIRSYAEEHCTLTTLVSGKVRIKSGTSENLLTPGCQAECKDNQMVVRQVDPSLYTSWYKGVLVFKNEPLSEIMETLSRWYDIEISYDKESLKHMRFTGELKRYRAVNEFLEKIESLKKVRFSIKDRTVNVSTYY